MPNETGMQVLGLRFTDSLASVIRLICEARVMFLEEEKTAIIEGLVKIYTKINGKTLNPSELVTIGEMTQNLAHDISILLGKWHENDTACEKKVIELDAAARNLAVVLDEINEWRSNLKDNY